MKTKIIASVMALSLMVSTLSVGLAQMPSATEIDVQLNVTNTTQGKDATITQNKPGDVIKVEATIKNIGTSDLIQYIPVITSEKLLKLGTFISAKAGVPQGQREVVYPGIDQEKDCNCQNTVDFTVKLNDDICTAQSTLVSSPVFVTIEDKLRSFSILCQETPVPPTPKPPKPPVTGPEMYIALLLGALGAGYYVYRKKMKVHFK